MTQLPEHPNLERLKKQAKDLLRSYQANEPAAFGRFRSFLPVAAAMTDAEIAALRLRLHDAQSCVARENGFQSWRKLKAHLEYDGLIGELKQAIDSDNLDSVKRLMTSYPQLHGAPLGYGKNGPLTWVAECRGLWEGPSEARLSMARWMIENGSDVHQGGDGPLMRAALNDVRLPMLDLLFEYDADVNAQWGGNYPIVCAPCEALAPKRLRWLLDHGADPTRPSSKYGTPLSILIGTYARASERKHACLASLVDWGLALPDTPTMAVHCGRIDLLERHLSTDPGLLARRFLLDEIFPPDTGMTEETAPHATPLSGVTLLHMAVDFDEDEVVRWLLDRGANPNAAASIDDEGFGGQTPLFHTVVTLGRKDDALTRVLLEAGADPRITATIRKRLRGMGDPEREQLREFHDVTPLEYARQFAEPFFVNDDALRVLGEFEGP